MFLGFSKTYFTNEDVEMLRNLADVLKKSGCHVEDWMLKMKKMEREKMEKKVHRKREQIGSRKTFSLKRKRFSGPKVEEKKKKVKL
jgi:ATP-dependent RNA helicase DDX52/ROK1